MGIDARMLVKITGPENWRSDEQVAHLAYDVAEAFGYDHFQIFDDPSYSQRAIQIVQPLSLDDAAEYEQPHLTGQRVVRQDGPPLIASDEEQFIRVNPATSYYHQSYERGDLPFLIALAEWLEYRIPDGRVFYGGDSSGVLLEPFERDSRNALFAHFAEVGHKPYDPWSFPYAAPASLGCSFCGGAPMQGSGGSSDLSFQSCRGCGKRAIASRKDGSLLRLLNRHEDWLTVLREMDNNPE